MRFFDEPKWIIDAHRGYGKRFVVPADELLAAFLELEVATSGQRDGFLGKGVCRASGRMYGLKFPRENFPEQSGISPYRQTVVDCLRTSSITSSDSFTLSSARLNKPQGPDLR